MNRLNIGFGYIWILEDCRRHAVEGGRAMGSWLTASPRNRKARGNAGLSLHLARRQDAGNAGREGRVGEGRGGQELASLVQDVGRMLRAARCTNRLPLLPHSGFPFGRSPPMAGQKLGDMFGSNTMTNQSVERAATAMRCCCFAVDLLLLCCSATCCLRFP